SGIGYRVSGIGYSGVASAKGIAWWASAIGRKPGKKGLAIRTRLPSRAVPSPDTRYLIPSTSPGYPVPGTRYLLPDLLPPIRLQDLLAQPNRLRRDLDELVVGDVFECLFERQHPRRHQPHQLL